MTTMTSLFGPTIAHQVTALEQRLDSLNRALSVGRTAAATPSTPGTNHNEPKTTPAAVNTTALHFSH